MGSAVQETATLYVKLQQAVQMLGVDQKEAAADCRGKPPKRVGAC